MYGYPSGYVRVSERAEPRRQRPVGIRPGRKPQAFERDECGSDEPVRLGTPRTVRAE